MLNDFTGALHVYIACGYTDIRKGIDGLAMLVQQQFQLDPCSDALFLFCGRKRDRIKALYWEGDGFVLLYKRLENGKYQWPRNSKEARQLTPQQYRWLMEGLNVEQPKAHRNVDGLEFGELLKNLDIASKTWYNVLMKNEHKTVPDTKKTVTISIEEYEALQELKAENARLSQQVQWLLEGIKLSRKKLFGASSEKSSASEQLSFLFNEAEVYEEQCAAEEEDSVPVAAHERKRRSGSVKDILPENVPVDVVEHRVPEEERICDECGTVMQEIGKEVRRTLQIIPAQVRIREDWYYTYACQTCKNEAEHTPVVKVSKEPAVIPGSFASPEAIAQIMTQKFVMGSPLYRQEQELERMGVHLSRQTMSNWVLRAAEDWLKPVYECLHRELVKRQVLHADETTLQVLHEPGKSAHTDSYMWLYRTSGDTLRHIVLYEYQPDRKAEHPKEFLKDFSGYLHTDGYKGYHTLPENIKGVGCWAHARRYFDDAVKVIPVSDRKNSHAYKGWSYCNQLFAIEDKLKKCSPEERYKQRQKRAKPILDAFLRWAQNRNAAPQSAFGKAIHYLLEQWPYLTAYLKDGRLEISNNRAERSIKPFVIDRKNFLFANTPGGAQGSAIIFSMIETAKENGLDPYKYLLHILQTAPAMDLETDVQQLLPWNVQLNK